MVLASTVPLADPEDHELGSLTRAITTGQIRRPLSMSSRVIVVRSWRTRTPPRV
jgi:hypothetical protein